MSVWFITGGGRGMGLDIAKAALAAGHKVVATGRNTDMSGHLGSRVSASLRPRMTGEDFGRIAEHSRLKVWAQPS